MRTPHSHRWSPGAKAWTSKPWPTRVSPAVCGEPRLGRFEILHGGHLDVEGIAFEHVGRRARPFGDRDVVGEVADAGGRGAPMRREDEGKAEGLRRLHGPQARARRGREHPAVGVDLLDGVAHRRSRRRRAVSLGGFDRPRDEGRGGEGPRRVVDEDDLRPGRRRWPRGRPERFAGASRRRSPGA